MSQVKTEASALPEVPSIGHDHVSLWRQADFRNLWIAETISQFGSQVTIVAFPLLAVLVLNASAAQMGFLNAAESAPALLFGLLLGVWVDRLQRRRLLIVADVARALLLFSIPIAWWLDVLRIEQLFVVAFLVGGLTFLFNVSWQAYVPSVVRRRRLVDANSKLHVSHSIAQVGGPGLGGSLVALLSAPLVILIDAISYLVSAFFVVRIKVEEIPEQRGVVGRSIRREVGEGLRSVFGNAILQPIALSGVVVSFFAGTFFAVYVLFMASDLGLGGGAIGLVLAAGGIGSLIGAGIAGRFAERIGEGRTVIVGRFLFGAFGIPIPLAILFPSIALPMIVISECLQWMAHVLALVSEISIRQAVTPDRLLGRMASTFTFLKTGAMPFGAISGGLLGEAIGVPATLVVATVGFMVAFLFVLFSPLRGYRGAPQEEIWSERV